MTSQENQKKWKEAQSALCRIPGGENYRRDIPLARDKQICLICGVDGPYILKAVFTPVESDKSKVFIKTFNWSAANEVWEIHPAEIARDYYRKLIKSGFIRES